MAKRKEPDSEATPQKTDDAAAASQEASADAPMGLEDTQKIEKPQQEGSEEEDPEAVMEELRNNLAAGNDRYLRLMAEFDNFKKRTNREYARLIESANEKLMLDLVNVRETFELAIKHGETGTDYGQLFEGVKLLFTKFDGVLSMHGLSAFAAPGERFDPQLHDALIKTPHADIPEDHIVDIHEKGYRLRERVIKHARVIVSSGAPETSENGEEAAV